MPEPRCRDCALFHQRCPLRFVRLLAASGRPWDGQRAFVQAMALRQAPAECFRPARD
jgi:hypothetical protein